MSCLCLHKQSTSSGLVEEDPTLEYWTAVAAHESDMLGTKWGPWHRHRCQAAARWSPVAVQCLPDGAASYSSCCSYSCACADRGLCEQDLVHAHASDAIEGRPCHSFRRALPFRARPVQTKKWARGHSSSLCVSCASAILSGYRYCTRSHHTYVTWESHRGAAYTVAASAWTERPTALGRPERLPPKWPVRTAGWVGAQEGETGRCPRFPFAPAPAIQRSPRPFKFSVLLPLFVALPTRPARTAFHLHPLTSLLLSFSLITHTHPHTSLSSIHRYRLVRYSWCHLPPTSFAHGPSLLDAPPPPDRVFRKAQHSFKVTLTERERDSYHAFRLRQHHRPLIGPRPLLPSAG